MVVCGDGCFFPLEPRSVPVRACASRAINSSIGLRSSFTSAVVFLLMYSFSFFSYFCCCGSAKGRRCTSQRWYPCQGVLLLSWESKPIHAFCLFVFILGLILPTLTPSSARETNARCWTGRRRKARAQGRPCSAFSTRENTEEAL